MLIASVLIAIFSTSIVSILINDNEFFNELESKTLTELQFAPKPLDPNPAILLVVLDEESAQSLQPKNATESLDRKYYGQLFLGLARANASVILSDIQFAKSKPSQDQPFILSIKKALKLNTTSFIFTTYNIESWEDPKEWDNYAASFTLSPEIQNLTGDVHFGHPLAFAPQYNVIGALPFKIDGESGDQYFHSALLAAWRHHGIDPQNAEIKLRYLKNGSWDSMLGYNHEIPLIWTQDKNDFPIESLNNTLQNIAANDVEKYKDKVIIVADQRQNRDEHTVPIHGDVPGSLILANLVNSCLAPSFERVAWLDARIQYAVIALITCISFLLTQSRHKFALAIAMLVPCLAGLLFPWLLATTQRIIFPTVWPFLASILAIVIGLGLHAINAPPKDSRIAGELTEATILFSDLTSSTEWVQRIGAVEYQNQFTSWLAICEKVIRSHGGHTERTTGDGFIAVFPYPPVRSSPAALESCQEILAAMVDSHPEFEVSFGFESGPVSGGYLTEAGRKVWSSTGTTVNMAKRLQSEAGSLNQFIVFGPIAARIIAEIYQTENLGRRKLKGIEGEIECFTIVDKSPV